MKIEMLVEPELEFGAGRHVDIRFGLKNYGPVTFDDPVAPHEIKVGLVGTATTIQGVKDWLEHCRTGLAGKPSKKPNLYPAFPGFGADSCFRCEWLHSPKLEGSISSRDLEDIIKAEPRSEGVPLLVERIIDECKRLCEKSPVDVFVCAPPQSLFDYADNIPVLSDEGDETPEEESTPRSSLDFHDLLKARSLELPKPLQMIRPVTYDEGVKELSRTGKVRQLQDPATRAWNFHTALYYKAGGTP